MKENPHHYYRGFIENIGGIQSSLIHTLDQEIQTRTILSMKHIKVLGISEDRTHRHGKAIWWDMAGKWGSDIERISQRELKRKIQVAMHFNSWEFVHPLRTRNVLKEGHSWTPRVPLSPSPLTWQSRFRMQCSYLPGTALLDISLSSQCWTSKASYTFMSF